MENSNPTLRNRLGELIRYGIIGVLTTGVNFLVYTVCTRLLFRSLFASDGDLYALVFNWVAWAFAVLFAFFANRGFVFRSRERGAVLLLQFLSFAGLRVASGAVENVTPSLLIRWFSLHDLLAKGLVAVVVILLNYLFTKFVTFARRSRRQEDKPGDCK